MSSTGKLKFVKDARSTRGFLLIFFLLVFGCGPDQSSPKQRDETLPIEGRLAFVSVNIVPMTGPEVLKDQTVVVEEGKIIAIGPSKEIAVPEGTSRIEARNRYLMPGLTDFHVHFPTEPKNYQCVLDLFLANGITRVVNMEGNADLLALRRKIASGVVRGPTMFTTGPFLNRPIVSTPEQVKQAVISQKAAGYDFIKLHGEVSDEEYQTLLAVARQQDIRVVGHVPTGVGLTEVLRSGQPLIVHAEEFLYSYFMLNRDLPTSTQEIDSMTRTIARETARAQTWVSPTLTVFNEIILQVNDIKAVLGRPEMAFLPSSIKQRWTPPLNPYVKRWKKEDVLRFSAQYRVMERLTKELANAGVPLLVGSDCLVPTVVPGFSIHDEMYLMARAGLSNYEILKAATVNASVFLNSRDQTGTIEVGTQADFILIDGNPIEDLTNIKKLQGVMLKGVWMPASDLQSYISNCSE
ncbi:MAG TPA: amidohydrolase family protein [Chryseosolibacter sp.]